ncbi:MAG TPA: hypothetical protein VFS43_38360 [Polyangiaceae bacterium]|nr:hypothetical protein [Polyangiaceae bacterium]
MSTFPDVNALVAALPARGAYVEKDSIASVANVHMTLWRAPGRPGLGEKPGSAAGLACSRLTQGAGPLFPVSGGKRNHCLSLTAFLSQPGTVQVVDRVWHSDSLSLNANAPQAVNSVALPARAGGGTGLELALEIWTPGGVTALSPSASYTDPVSGAGRTATMAAGAVPGSAIAGRFFPFTLQGTDRGVSSVQTCTTGLSGVAGEGGLVLYRPLFELVLPSSTSTAYNGFSETGLFEIPDDACLALLDLTATATSGKVRVEYKLVQAVPG